jgi:hypothetical protein
VELGIIGHGPTENFRKQRPLVIESTVVGGAAHCDQEQLSYCEFPQRLQAPSCGQWLHVLWRCIPATYGLLVSGAESSELWSSELLHLLDHLPNTCGLLLGRLRALNPGSRDHLVSTASSFPQCVSLLRIIRRVSGPFGYHPPELAFLHCETDGKKYLSLGHQGRNLSNSRSLLNTVQILLMLIMSLCCTHLFYVYFSYKCAGMKWVEVI